MDWNLILNLATCLSLFVFIALIGISVMLCIVIPIIIERRKYQSTSYYKSTHKTLRDFDKGSYGEYLLYTHLQFLEQYGCKFLFNVYLPKRNGQTTEIDLILVSPKGIFVIESKNYSGWVFGHEDEPYWTQTFPNGECYQFYNPIMQNDGHIYHLKNFLNKDLPIYSVIAFADSCTLQDVYIQNDNVYLAYYSDIARIVENIYNKTPPNHLDVSQIDAIYNALYFYSQASDAHKYQHAENAYAARYAPTLNCPQCGGRLMLRTTQKGKNKGNKFYGCSNFPTCQYIRHIDNQ